MAVLLPQGQILIAGTARHGQRRPPEHANLRLFDLICEPPVARDSRNFHEVAGAETQVLFGRLDINPVRGILDEEHPFAESRQRVAVEENHSANSHRTPLSGFLDREGVNVADPGQNGGGGRLRAGMP